MPGLEKTSIIPTKVFLRWQGVSQKIKPDDVFSKLRNYSSVYQRSPPWLATRKKFLLQPLERWKTPSWERNISEHDIIQHTNQH